MPGSLLITGGTPLRGSVRVAGSKNAALPMMAAAILTDGPVVLEGIPELTDVATLCRVLEELGVSSRWSKVTPVDTELTQVAPGTVPAASHGNGGPRRPTSRQEHGLLVPSSALRLHAVDSSPVRARYELVRSMRASFCVLGPLLARRGKAVVSLPGGCTIGPRPVELHLKGLAALGADLTLAHGYVMGRAKRLRGAAIDLSGPAGPTVTGTANVLSAAVLAQGETLLYGAAQEPEIVDLGRLLCKMGARIDGLGTALVRIRGVEALHAARHRIIPDRIEAATLALAVAATRGTATIFGALPGHLTSLLHKMADAGIDVASGADWIRVAAPRTLRSCSIAAKPFPGVPSDAQAQWTALMTLASGRSVVADRVFPQRFAHAPELNRLGARIRLSAGAAVVEGVGHLDGATVTASDLRASAALVLAGLAARGRTRVEQIHWLDRGYEKLDRKLTRLGASVQRLATSNKQLATPQRAAVDDGVGKEVKQPAERFLG